MADDAYDDFVHWLHYAEGSAVTPFVIEPIATTFGKLATPLARRVDWEMNLNLGFINNTLENRTFLLGDDFSAADIQMSFVGELACAGPHIQNYQNIDRWVHRFQERPAYKTAVERGGYYKFQRA